jgi:hypothetical protein
MRNMSSTWPESPGDEGLYDSESAYDGDAAYDGDGVRSEDARSDAQRRARARRIALARRRLATRRACNVRRTVPGRPPQPLQAGTVTALRNLDLETKAGQDSRRLALDRANQQASRATYASVAGLAIDQALDTFGPISPSTNSSGPVCAPCPWPCCLPGGSAPDWRDWRSIPGSSDPGSSGGVGRRPRRRRSVPHPGYGRRQGLDPAHDDRRARDRQPPGQRAGPERPDDQRPADVTSPDSSVLRVTADGTFTRISSGRIFITATVGDYSQDFEVRVK